MSTLLNLFTTRNVGWPDRLLRALPAPVVAYLVWQGVLPSWAAWALGVAAALLLVTSISGSCSVYYLLGYSTCPLSGKKLR